MKNWRYYLSAVSLIVLAVIFHNNTILASICLVGLVAFIVLSPIYEKFRNLLRFAAEFSTQGLSVRAESQTADNQSSNDLIQKQVENQLSETGTELSQAVDSLMQKSNPSIPEEVRKTIRDAIEEYTTIAQSQAVQAIDNTLERIIFEFVLFKPRLYEALIDHLTYVCYGKN
jgi:predicted PurR-regulated permease PerM